MATAAIAGHKMSGFAIDNADLELLNGLERSKFTVEEFIARIKAANSGR